MHTKGPWTLDDKGDKWLLNGGNDWIATIISGYDGDQANARLIAAAPKMKLELECVAIALNDYYEGMEEWDDGLLAGVTEALEEVKGE